MLGISTLLFSVVMGTGTAMFAVEQIREVSGVLYLGCGRRRTCDAVVWDEGII